MQRLKTFWKRDPRASDESSAGRPFLEIQYHPGNIRKGVRYLFLSRRQVLLGVAGVLAYGFFLTAGLWLMPRVISGFLVEQRYEEEQMERREHGQRLAELVERLRELEATTDDVHLEMSKIHLAYGVPGEESQGQGGYTPPPHPVPHSLFQDEIERGNLLEARIGGRVGALEVLFEEVRAFEELHRDEIRTTPSISPLKEGDFVLTSPYGNRISPFTKARDFHAGIDLAAPTGTPIYAPADGFVSWAGLYPLKKNVGWWRYGNLVVINHGERFLTFYGHCEDIHVKYGDRVKQGDLIGTVGNTGWSTNPHLHYEVRKITEDGDDYRPVDPRIYILDHRWSNEEQLLIRARHAPDGNSFEPLPRSFSRQR
jgi:murein DD-endopeptidase MepM/ murein hydrolase activator NlpD